MPPKRNNNGSHETRLLATAIKMKAKSAIIAKGKAILPKIAKNAKPMKPPSPKMTNCRSLPMP